MTLSRHIDEEGIRIEPALLFRAGRRDEELMGRILAHVLAEREHRPAGDVTDSPWRHGLMNWGHDPLTWTATPTPVMAVATPARQAPDPRRAGADGPMT
jgi:hypothetical protein